MTDRPKHPAYWSAPWPQEAVVEEFATAVCTVYDHTVYVCVTVLMTPSPQHCTLCDFIVVKWRFFSLPHFHLWHRYLPHAPPPPTHQVAPVDECVYFFGLKRLQVKIFIIGLTYVPKVKGQPCLSFVINTHIFYIWPSSIRIWVQLFTSSVFTNPSCTFFSSVECVLYPSPIFSPCGRPLFSSLVFILNQSIAFLICPVIEVHRNLTKAMK